MTNEKEIINIFNNYKKAVKFKCESECNHNFNDDIFVKNGYTEEE